MGLGEGAWERWLVGDGGGGFPYLKIKQVSLFLVFVVWFLGVLFLGDRLVVSDFMVL